MLALALLLLNWDMPPKAYREPPLCDVKVHYVPRREVGRACRALGLDAYTAAHAYACTKGCFRIEIDPCEYYDYIDKRDNHALLACHENAHTNGWPADHPQRPPNS